MTLVGRPIMHKFLYQLSGGLVVGLLLTTAPSFAQQGPPGCNWKNTFMRRMLCSKASSIQACSTR